MKERRIPSAIPIYLAAAVWLLYCLVAPMLRWYQYALGLGIAVVAYLVLRHFFPDTVVKVEVPEKKTGDAALDEAIAKGRAEQKQLLALRNQIAQADMAEKLDAIIDLHRKVIDTLHDNPTKFGQARQFLAYYPTTTIRLLETYQKLRQLAVSEGNIAEAMQKIRRMLTTVATAYQRELDSLYDRDVMDITADIQVMEQMMAGDGLFDDTNA